jgi:hypothetical protein
MSEAGKVQDGATCPICKKGTLQVESYKSGGMFGGHSGNQLKCSIPSCGHTRAIVSNVGWR